MLMSEQDNGYGYAWKAWLANEDPAYIQVNQPFSDYSAGEGQELSIKHREMVMIGILAFRSRQEAVVAHMRRAIAHGATKRELLEALYAAQIPGGGPTLSVGVRGLIELEQEDAFKNG
jgi:alkylhydroperoxidase/carboxymuconolactone decarboxylase family protein YurZ